ncbi:MAG: hypothetical protein BWY17_01046 [Deltaproteobacteria bacterium ADurb.Bin207]|nr:MAG: hypothetical protein BWY17_01046 [Deltaproteobacteria bacterium ADurb.Bin207]
MQGKVIERRESGLRKDRSDAAGERVTDTSGGMVDLDRWVSSEGSPDRQPLIIGADQREDGCGANRGRRRCRGVLGFRA